MNEKKHCRRYTGLWVALLVAVLLSPLASSFPDGLERVAEDHGFADNAISLWQGFFPDYAVTVISLPSISTALAGIIGTILVFGLLLALGCILSAGNQAALIHESSKTGKSGSQL